MAIRCNFDTCVIRLYMTILLSFRLLSKDDLVILDSLNYIKGKPETSERWFLSDCFLKRIFLGVNIFKFVFSSLQESHTCLLQSWSRDNHVITRKPVWLEMNQGEKLIILIFFLQCLAYYCILFMVQTVFSLGKLYLFFIPTILGWKCVFGSLTREVHDPYCHDIVVEDVDTSFY